MFFTGVWWYWGLAEMYHEGWWGAWTNRLPYLVPGGACLLLSLIGFHWPRAGSLLLLLAGIAFSVFWWGEDLLDNYRINWDSLPIWLGLGGAVLVMSALFWIESRQGQRRAAAGIPPHRQWWRRHLSTVLLLSLCLVIAASVSSYYLPIVLTREDDGLRTARRIEGQGISLIWAPLGPGWNWKQSWGGYPSWNSLALYGVEPVGLDRKPLTATEHDMQHTNLCAYLDESGLHLLDEPAYIWRMPVVDDLVRSLARHGTNAGCVWDGTPGMLDCARLPDKETPLWAPDLAPIYYWSAQAYDDQFAYYVSYNGAVQRTLKTGGNPRHGYRCVKAP